MMKIKIHTNIADLLISVIMLIAITISAENVQRRANKFRIDLMTLVNCKYSAKTNGKWVKMLKDRETLKFTVWGLFVLRKPVLLSMFAWPFAYGLILVEYLSSN
ncbi:hypothetical protein CDAR_266091 [Caerostris darwini]|uniref:Uncharacterized protein n=1 Tax=Caerostris darwini TaxID=1538125 RepID=A0AAV4QW45_9ARAC|nr:hypothetical protein CDAR_266091 [Caerostris darwini]